MRLNRTIGYILFLVAFIYLNILTIFFSFTTSDYYLNRSDELLGVKASVFLPNSVLYLVVMMYQISIPSIIILISLFVFQYRVRQNKTWKLYSVYMIMLFIVYFVITVFNTLMSCGSGCVFSWIDDVFGKRGHDFILVFGYFFGNAVFMLLYIPAVQVLFRVEEYSYDKN